MKKNHQKMLAVALGLMVGGALGALAYSRLRGRRYKKAACDTRPLLPAIPSGEVEVERPAFCHQELCSDPRIKRQQKALMGVMAIVLGGFLFACVYHFVEGSLWGKGYPCNTFLFNPANRHSDYFDVIRAAIFPDPYATRLAVYFPFSYSLFRFLDCIFRVYAGFYLLFIAASVVLVVWISSMLESLKLTTPRRIASAVIIAGCSYPVLFCWDRGNIEILLLACVLLFLHFFYRDKYWTALLFLLPAICMKLYPAALLALYLPKRYYLPIVTAGLAAIVLTSLSLLSFENPVRQELWEWQGNMALFKADYLIGNGAMGSGSSPWNILKTGFIDWKIARASYLSIPIGPEWAGHLVASLRSLLQVYSVLMLLLALYLTWHILFVEKDVRRQTILLLLFMVIAPAGGADYKMVYVVPAIVLMITLSERKYDFFTLLYTALVLIPKKYFFIPGLVTDSGYADASYAVYINPILMMASMGLIIASGWNERKQSALKRS